MQLTYRVHYASKARLNESLAGIKIASTISDMQMIHTTVMAESKKELKSLLMRVKEECEKTDLKLNIQKTNIMASGPITSKQIDGEKVERVKVFIFLGSKITPGGECSHEIKRHLLLGRKAMTNLDSVSGDVILWTKVLIVKAMVFLQSCMKVRVGPQTRLRAEELIQLWCWRRLLRVSWTARRSNQSILKEINSEYSLEGLTRKLQSFGHPMRRTASL